MYYTVAPYSFFLIFIIRTLVYSYKLIFVFSDEEFMFQEQHKRTTAENLMNYCSPVVESVFLYAQPKIYLLLRLVEFSNVDDSERRLDVNSSYETDVKEETIRVCGLVRGLQDKATVAHIYHYYSLKLGEVWNENDVLSQDAPMSPIESQSIDIMTVRHAYLIALIKMIKSEVCNLNASNSVSQERDLQYLYFFFT